jgi:putative membrane protein
MSDQPTTNKPDKAGDHLANERTFLAWVRTSISVIVFGFVVAKFGLFLRQFLRPSVGTAAEGRLSMIMGVAFMGMGVFMAIVALYRYRVTLRRLESGEFKPARAVIVFVGLITALFGAALAIYLIVTARTF